MADSRKGGIFNSAKFSERVFKNLPDGVRRGVKRDLAFITRRDPNANNDKWNKAVVPEPRPSVSNVVRQRQFDSFEPSPASSVPVQSSRAGKCVGNDVSSIVQAQIAAKAAALGNNRQFSTAREELENLRRSRQPFVPASATPPMFKSPPKKKPCVPDTRKSPAYPMNRSGAAMAKSILKGLPHLSLQNNDAMMYESAVNRIIKDAIKTKVRPSSRNVKTVKNSPISQLLNQTAPLSLSHLRTSNHSMPPPIDDEEPTRDVTRYIQSNASAAETTADISLASAFDPFNQSTISVDSTLTRKILARNNTTHNVSTDNANTSKFSLSSMRRMMNNSSFGNTTANETATKSISNLSVLSNIRPSGSKSSMAQASESSPFTFSSNPNDLSFLKSPDPVDNNDDDEFLNFILNSTPSDTNQSDRGSRADDDNSLNDSVFIFED